MTNLYVLEADGKTPLAMEDVLVWGRWYEDYGAKRIVAQTEKDGVLVSTVFLGIDHNFLRKGTPVLWETMIFGGERDGEMKRYSSYEDAVSWHETFCQEVFGVKP